MSAQNPRDMREYFRILERKNAQLRSIPALIEQGLQIIVEDNDKDKVRHPAPPIELDVQTAFYIDTSFRRRVRLSVDFPDVIFNTDGTQALIQQYELWGRDETPSLLRETTSAVPRQAAPGLTMPGLASTITNEDIAAQAKPWMLESTNIQSFFRAEGFIPGSIWRFRARALGISTTEPGAWSDEFVVEMLEDEQPPAQPTAPTVVSSRGQLTVTWDGLSVSGAMPPDFKYAILAQGSESSPTFEIARFGRGGGFKVVSDLDYYDPQHFRVRAVDESGNAGPWSEEAVGYTTPLVDKDLILSTIDGAKTHLKNIDAGVSILPNTIITEHLVVTEEMTASIANFLVVNADMINVNSLFADEIFTGLLDATVVRADMFEGLAFEGGVFTTTKGGRFQTNIEEYTGLKIDSTGMLGYSRGGVETFRYDAGTGNVSIAGGTFTGGAFQTHPDPVRGLKIDSAGMRGHSALGVETFRYDSATGDVSIGGGTFTGGTFRTQEEEFRGIKLDSGGMKGYNAAGEMTFQYQSVNGNVSIAGGTYTGGKFQTQEELNRGLKIVSSGLIGYGPTGGQTFKYDAATGDVSIGGGVFTGGKFQSSPYEEQGVKLDPSGLKIWNSKKQLTLDATPTGSTFTGRVNSGFGASKAILADNIFGGRPGISLETDRDRYAQPFIISYGSSNSDMDGALYLSSAWPSAQSNPSRLIMYPDGRWVIGGKAGTLGMNEGGGMSLSGASGQLLIGVNGTTKLAGSPGEGHLTFTNGRTVLSAAGSNNLQISQSAVSLVQSNSVWLQVFDSGTSIQGGLTVSGSKNFVMPHPTKKGMELLHGSTESPVSGIEYWGEGTVGPAGEDVFELPDYFEALAKPEGRVVMVLGRGEVLDWSDVVDGKATVYGKPGTKYSWLVKAERFGGDFEVERKAQVPPDTAGVTDPLMPNAPLTP